MSDTKLENKHIEIGSNNYRLTIKKKKSIYTHHFGYKAFLSDMNSQYTNSAFFLDIGDLEKGLRAWIIKADMLNNPESAIFQQLEEWDGVINI